MNDTLEERSALLDWVERAAIENIKAQIQVADELKRDANVALNLLLAGGSGALAYAGHLFGSGSLSYAWAALATSLWLFALGAIDLRYCLWVGDFPAPTNEPKELMRKDVDFESLRVKELDQLQVRIEDAQAKNELKAFALNFIRAAAVVTPVIPALSLLVLRSLHVS